MAPTCVTRAFFAQAGGFVCFFLAPPVTIGGGGTFSPPLISASTSPSTVFNLCSCIGEVSVNALSSCGIGGFCKIGTTDGGIVAVAVITSPLPPPPPLPPLPPLPLPIAVARGEVAGEGTKRFAFVGTDPAVGLIAGLLISPCGTPNFGGALYTSSSPPEETPAVAKSPIMVGGGCSPEPGLPIKLLFDKSCFIPPPDIPFAPLEALSPEFLRSRL